MLRSSLQAWRRLPPGVRKSIVLVVKATLTVGAFYLLLTHAVRVSEGGRPVKVSVLSAILEHVGELDVAVFLPFVLAATLIKVGGILSSMLRWHLLLRGQGIRFNFWHIVGAFLTGRFLGTFLPSTWGLDGYKLYDAARFSDRMIEPAAATAVEKVIGMSGLFLTFLVTAPLGYAVLGPTAAVVLLVTVPMALAALSALFLLLFRPRLIEWMLGRMPAFGRRRVEVFVQRVSRAVTAYRGKGRLLATVILLSFLVHFTTAVMYYFTAVGVGAAGARFWQVSFASSIQIFATVISPFTIAGEGVREIVQALLLARHIGYSESILSAALGFWAAEAMTLVGGFFLWSRGAGYRPRIVEVTAPPPEAVPESGQTTAAVPG